MPNIVAIFRFSVSNISCVWRTFIGFLSTYFIACCDEVMNFIPLGCLAQPVCSLDPKFVTLDEGWFRLCIKVDFPVQGDLGFA
jgi:hypothetical protein